MGKAEFMVNVRVWPLRSVLDPYRWLSNFHEHEMEVAVHILDQFMYFGEELLNAAFFSGFQRISASMLDTHQPLDLNRRWRDFLSEVLVTPVQGEDNNISDSGRVFGRKARQVLGIGEEHLHEPQDAAHLAKLNGRPLVLIDDFVGSGEQMIEMWETLGLESVAKAGVPIYYAPALATAYGAQNIIACCDGLHLSAGQVIPRECSATERDSILWPAGKGEEYLKVVRQASLRAGIPDTNGKSVDDWQGFHNLGLALAMHGSIPDATLAIFRWECNGWNPLIKRQ